MIDNNTTEEKYISQVVLPPIEEGDNERLYLIKDRNARDNIETLQSNLTSLNEEVNTLDTKVDNIKIPDISNLVTTDNLNNKVSNLITRNELDNTYVKWSTLTSNYSNNFVLNNSYAHTTNGIIDNATVDYTDVNDLYSNYAHTNANGTIDNANISYANINNLYNNYAHINNGEIDNATIDHSNINNLNTNYAHINNGTIDNANIDYANVNNLENNYAHIENGVIDNATINYSNINELENNYAHITNGKIDNATIDQAKVNNLSSNYAHITNGEIDNATINYAKIDELNSNYAHINNGIIDNASINYANVNDLETNYAHITDGTIDNATISYANIDNLENNYAHINNGVIDNAKIDYGDVRFLDSHYAHISEGIIDNALIGYANVEQLDSHYAEIDMANVNNAWIENGIIKDGVIEDAKIAGVSANKITAGTIDAANVNVINLRTDNLTVKKINGQPVIGGGYTLVDSSILDYLEKNPSNERWYEFYDNAYHPTNDITVDSNKNYYTTSESVSLYDQNTIDNMFSNINERIDSQIETWTVDTVPLLNNEPAVNWTTDDEKDEHIGDICYVVNAASDYDGFTYRFTHDNTSDQYSWVLIQDNQVTAALGRITNLESFNNQLVHWENATDEGVITVRGRITELSGRIDKTVKSSIQLWYTKADTTVPTAPNAAITNTNTNGNAWTTVVPTYNSSYPYYFYCWQYQYEDNTYGWSVVIYDQATSESEERARIGVANAATAQNTANANIKSSIQLWFAKANNTEYPAKPTTQITNNNANGNNAYNQWNLVIPIYNSSYPYYFYCYQQQKGDDTYQWTDVVYDNGAASTQAAAQTAEGILETFEQTTFKDVTDTIDEQATAITTLTTITENNGLTTSTNISNTVNSVSQKADSNSAKITNLTQTLGTNADGTTAVDDIVHQISDIEQDLDGITTRVGKTEISLKGTYATCSTTAATQNKVATIFPAITDDYELESGTTITVKFITNNTSSTPTLNVNSSGAKAIKTYSGATLSEAEYKWDAGATMTFVYDGTYWRIQDSTELTRLKNNESSISQTANSITSLVANTATYTAPDGTTQINTIKSAIQQNASDINLRVEKSGVIAAINASVETDGTSAVKISADKVNIEGAAIFSGNGRLSQDSLNNTYASTDSIPSDISELTDTTNIIPSDLSDLTDENSIIPDISDKADKSSAIAEEQIIYIQAVSGTNSINAYPSSATTTSSYWITQTGESIPSGTPPNSNSGQTPRWTLKRPSYQKNYPIVFVAKQRKTVSGVITCTTPIKDDTTTIIDGGHITTGAIDAGLITTGTLNAGGITVTNLTADNIIAGRINGEPVTQATLNGSIQNNINTISDATTSALNNLATIENVVDTLTWVTEHGTMTPTTDNTIDPTKVYFILDNNGDYTVRNNKYSIVQEPNVSNLSNYYELTIDKSIQNYIATHLSLTNEGLWLVPMATESDGCKILVATGGSGKNYPEAGTYIIDRITDSDNNTTETVVAQFTSTGISFAEDRSFHIGDESAFIHFSRDNNGIGHINIGGSQVTIGGNTTLQQLLNKYNSTITSNDISVSKSGNTATITIGNDSVNIVDGAAGEDGAQILGITTAPSSYTTTTNGFTPTYRIALSTVKTQSGASEVKIGDILAYSYYHYPVGYVDASYVYCGVRNSIRGETGAPGHSPVITTTKNNDGSVTINVDGTPMSTVDAGEDGDTPVITTTKGSDGSVTIYIDGVLSNTVEAGANGTSYYTYIRYSANADGSNMVITPTTATKYIGVYTGTSSSVPSYTEFEWSKYVGENGNDADPLIITSTTVDYQLSTSGTTEPTGIWSETPLAPTTTQYLWTRTILTFSDNTTITSYSVGGKTGQDGATGGRWYAGTSITGVSTTGRTFSGSGIASAVVGDMYLNTSTQNTYRCIIAGAPSTAKWVYVSNIKGNSVTNVEHQYYLSTSSTTAPLENDNNWKATPDPYVEGHYYWERWKIMFSAADTQYTTPTLAEEITSAWAAIEKTNEEINLRATKTEMYQTAQPNLAPIGSVDFSNIYNINTNPNGYWRTALNGTNTWFTQLDDGWIHIYIDNSEGIEDINNLDFSPDSCPSIIPGNPYTILTEIRNNSSLGTDENNTNFYLDEVNNNQFWGNIQNEQIDDEYITTSTNIELLTCGQTNTLYSYRLADTSHIADINEAIVGEGIVGRAVIVDNNSATQNNNNNNNSLPSLFCYNFQCAAGSILDFDFRMSVYEGIYNGPYKPYSGPQLYSSQAELKVQADRIGMIVANNNAESNLQLTADAMSYIGDHVEIKGTDGTSTVISGGQIQTGSLSIGAFDSAAQSATLNNNINIGGRNWLLDTGTFKGWPRSVRTSLSNGVATFSSRSSLSWVFLRHLTIPVADFFGNTWTFSFDYRSDDFSDTSGNQYIDVSLEGGATYNASGRTKYRELNHSSISGAANTWIPTTEWQRGSVTFTATDESFLNNGSGDVNYIGIDIQSYTLNSFQVRHIKLERGNKATDWTPASEDVDNSISDAAKTATSYVTDIDSNGITIHPSRSDYTTNGGRAVINGDGLTIYVGSNDVASYGASARIGKANSDRVIVDSTNGIAIYKGNNKKLQTTGNGIDIYGNDGMTNIASFGAMTRIGRISQGHANISENGFNYLQGNESVFSVEAYGEQIYELGTEYGDQVEILAGETATVSITYDSQIVLEEPKCVYKLDNTEFWKEIDFDSSGTEPICYDGVQSSTTVDNSLVTLNYHVCNNTSSSIIAIVSEVFDRRSVSTRIGKTNSDRVTVDPTNGIIIYKGNNKKLQTTANGIDIYQDNDTYIASFGSTTKIGAENNVQVIIESDSFGIKNQLGNEFFNIEGRSSNQTVDRSPVEVCEWSNKNNVNEDVIEVAASNIITSTASNFTPPSFNITINDEEFELDSSQVEYTILTDQININLTTSGVTFIQNKMTNTYNEEYETEEGNDNNIIVGTDFPCIFYVTYSRTVADKAILDFTGNQTIKGYGDLLTLSNNVSNTTSTLARIVNTKTNKSIKFGIGTNGATRGVWDETARNWIICHDADNKVVIQGPNFGVSSAGDIKANAITMTGNLTTPILTTKNPSKAGTYRTTDGKLYTLTPFNSYDKNGARIGYSSIVVVGNSSNTSVNRIYRSFAVNNLKTNKIAAIYINNYDDGTAGMTFAGTDFAKNTRHSLGANSAGIWPRSLGGTGVAERQSDTVTVTTANVIQSVNGIYHNGIVCTVYYSFSLKNALTASTDTLTVGTVPSNYRPTSTFYGTAYCNSSALEHPNILFFINTSGVIAIMNRCGESISTGVTIRITATYVI